MRNTVLLAIAAAVMLACGAVFAAPAAEPVTGQVVNSKGKPVAGATVYVFGFSTTWISNGPRQTFKADKNGRFTYTPKSAGEPVGARTFAAWAPGYACGGGDATGKQPVKIVLYPRSTVKGKVVDENGKPLAGATISVAAYFAMPKAGSEYVILPGPIPNAMTSQVRKDGSFVVNDVPDRALFRSFQCMFRVSGRGRAGSVKMVPGEQIAQGIKIVAQPACALEGALYMPDKSAPAAKGTKLDVTAMQKQDFYLNEVAVDANGRFKLTDLPPGKASITLVYGTGEIEPGRVLPSTPAPKWVLANGTEPEMKPSQPTKIDLVLCKGSVVKGVVTDKNTGKPVPKARISFGHKGVPRMAPPEMTMTDDQGRFEWRVPPGPVKVALMSVGVHYVGQNGPSVEFTAVEGQEKTDIELVYDAAEARRYQSDPSVPIPIPADFELKPGTYDLAWDPKIECSSAVRSGVVKAGKELGTLIRKAPVLHSKNAYRAAFAVDGTDDKGLIAVIIDESKGTGKGFDIAHIDINRNGDLTDDKPVKITSQRGSNYFSSSPVTVQARQGREESGVSNPVALSLYVWVQGGRIPYCQLFRHGTWKGMIDTSKGKVECAVVDANSNGIYGEPAQWNEKSMGLGQGDQFYVDSNGAGHVTIDSWQGHGVGLYPVTRLGSKFYLITTNETGNQVTVQPYAGPMGQLLVRGTDINGAKAEAVSVSVSGRQGAYEFGDAKGLAVTLPAGEYRVNDCQMILKSKNGTNLPMSCTVDSPVTVNKDAAATVEVSGKVTAKVNPGDEELVWKPGSRGSLDYAIKIGDKVIVNKIGGSGSAYPPTVKFIDSKGKTVASAKGQFG